MKPALLYLCHRIPYPPNKGDKIRSFHLLQHLSSRCRVFLGAFIDAEGDWEYTSELDRWCEQTQFLHLNPAQARIRSLTGLLTGKALTLPYYYDARMAHWVSSVVTGEKIDAVVIYSSAMAQYVLDSEYGSMRRIMDLVDVDSDKWRQYSEKKSWPMNWLYRREADKLFAFERRSIAMLDYSFFVSGKEAEMFTRLAPETLHKVGFFNNGVDTEHFSPGLDVASPYSDSCQAVVFTGAMDYWPNEDAVAWFAQEEFPKLKRQWPMTVFYIVGSNPTEQVISLGKIDGVVVTGKVADVRPYIKHAAVVVAPMRIARGIQNKVLEGMAMARPVVVTTMGLEGIEAEDGREVLIADDTDGFLEQIDIILQGGNRALGVAARERVCRDFTWEQSLPRIDAQLGLT
ncbi:MAG: TIGR03087 family PEP-CTERM/XrtA system glycosyltransferase [Gammaproteobacteria bacterium]